MTSCLLLASHSFIFCLLKISSLLLIFKDFFFFFARYKSLRGQGFFFLFILFNILKMLLHCLLSFKISHEKPSIICIDISIYLIFLLPQNYKIFNLSLVFSNVALMCPHVIFFTFILLGVYCFLAL